MILEKLYKTISDIVYLRYFLKFLYAYKQKIFILNPQYRKIIEAKNNAMAYFLKQCLRKVIFQKRGAIKQRCSIAYGEFSASYLDKYIVFYLFYEVIKGGWNGCLKRHFFFRKKKMLFIQFYTKRQITTIT